MHRAQKFCGGCSAEAADSHSKSVSNRTALCNQPSATAAMNDDTPLPFDLPAVRPKKLTVDFNGGNQSSDAGLLLLREADRKLGVCRRLAAAMPDRRDPDRIRRQPPRPAEPVS